MQGRILVLDDSNTFRRELADVLEQQFEVVIVKSRADALALCEHWLPDCVVLDLDNVDEGIDTCLGLREVSAVPILFAAEQPSLEVQMAAFNAGASDLLTKPVASLPLLRKTQLAIDNHRQQIQLEAERSSLKSVAESIQSSLDQSSILMNFVRASIRCRTYEELAQRLTDAVRELNISCFGEIRRGNELPVRFRTEGDATALEDSLMAKLVSMGRVFQFSSRLVVNYPQVSIIVHNLPREDAALADKIREHIAVLAETTDALCENVQMRQNAGAHAEQLQLAMMQANSAAITLRDGMKQTLLDARLLLQELEDNVHRAHSWLGTTADQERAISNMMDDSIQRILATISRINVDEQMDAILGTMSVGDSSTDDIELF